MTIERFQLLRNVGQFDSVNAGAQIPLTKLSLIYAENGRGKTTLAAILRSLSSNNPDLINERRRLGAAHPPHIVLNSAGAPHVFQDGVWTAPKPQVAVFDDAFVAANVCSGVSIETVHRQNLHELILGAQGVTLNATLQSHVSRIEDHNRSLRTKGEAVPAGLRGALTVDAFCALTSDPNVETKIQAAERSLAAARSSEAIRLRATFAPLELPPFDVAALNDILRRNLPELESQAAQRVRVHIRSLGKGGETWIGDGMGRVDSASEDKGHAACPFCAQDLAGSDLIQHYQVYFSEAYRTLRGAINEAGTGINGTHGGEIPAAFERAVRMAIENCEFWRAFTDIPNIDVDTAAISRAWTAAREAVLAVLRAKATAPLDAMEQSAETIAAIEAYEARRVEIADLSDALQARNAPIALVKEQAAGANVATLTADLANLVMVRARHEAATAALCEDYLGEKSAKAATETLRDQARAALDQYRQTVFPAYQTAINEYLQRFNAGFRLGSVTSINTRGGSSVSYHVVINNVQVALTANEGPSFKNTLSAGDRNTLALAFFFASLDREPQLAQWVVVIDDPMTSLDEHRSLTTVQEMMRLTGRISQMLVLSHSKAFLCAIWEPADRQARSAIRVVREGAGSSLAVWDVRQDCITEHDKRHEQIRNHIQAGNPATERSVAAALRPVLEAFMRVAFPADFPPGQLLGPFIGVCQQRHGTANEILNSADTIELRALLDYANRFHHDTNSAWETAAINDQELVGFASRTLRFTTR